MTAAPMPDTDTHDLLRDGAMSVADAVTFTALSRAELYRRMLVGQLPFVAQGRRRLIPRRALVAMLAAGLRGGAARSAA